MSPDETVSQGLITQLSAEVAAWQALLNLMTEEEQVLVDGEADRLEPLNASKLAQLHTLNNLARARQDALLAAGLSAMGFMGWWQKRKSADVT